MRLGLDAAVAAGLHGENRGGDLLDDVLGDIPPAVEAVIEDHPRLVPLGVVVAPELGEAVARHVGEKNIADLAAGVLLHVVPQVLHPVEEAQPVFALHRDDDHLAGALQRGALVQGEGHLPAGLVLQQAQHVPPRIHPPAVHREQVGARAGPRIGGVQG